MIEPRELELLRGRTAVDIWPAGDRAVAIELDNGSVIALRMGDDGPKLSDQTSIWRPRRRVPLPAGFR
jgi:hypothetical protein